VITSAAVETQALFVALSIFFGMTALVIGGLIFLIGRSSARKARPPVQKP
jgi:hypothetical protein